MSSCSIVMKHRETWREGIGGQRYEITSHKIAKEVEPPITNIMIRFCNISVGMSNTCSSCSPTSSIVIFLITSKYGHGYPLRYTGIKDGVTLRGQGSHENGGKHTREWKDGSTDKTKIWVAINFLFLDTTNKKFLLTLITMFSRIFWRSNLLG